MRWNGSFDSILVRLKVGTITFVRKLCTGFDSILVRLKEGNLIVNTIANCVSIPYWFD